MPWTAAPAPGASPLDRPPQDTRVSHGLPGGFRQDHGHAAYGRNAENSIVQFCVKLSSLRESPMTTRAEFLLVGPFNGLHDFGHLKVEFLFFSSCCDVYNAYLLLNSLHFGFFTFSFFSNFDFSPSPSPTSMSISAP